MHQSCKELENLYPFSFFSSSKWGRYSGQQKVISKVSTLSATSLSTKKTKKEEETGANKPMKTQTHRIKKNKKKGTNV